MPPVHRMAVYLALGAFLIASAAVARYCLRKRPAPRRNVILLVVDCLRADRLGCYGYTRKIDGREISLTPNIDGLAAKGALFELAFSQSNWTETSMASMIYSVRPLATSHHHTYAYLTSPEDTLTYFLDYGYIEQGPYVKIAVQTNPLLVASPFAGAFDIIINLSGFPRVFKHATTQASNGLMHQRADVVHRKALDAIALAGENNIFLYIHYMDMHEPYAPVERFRQLFAPGVRYDFGALAVDAAQRPDADDVVQRVMSLRDDYDASLMFLDEQIGLFLAELDRRGVLKESLLIFASDHGQSLGERGVVGHAHTLYPQETHVPLILAGPDVPAARVRTRVRNLDIFPTIAAWIGISPSQYGEDLMPLVEAVQRREMTTHREVFSCMDFPPVNRHLKREMLIAPSGAACVITSDDDGRTLKEEYYEMASDPQMQSALDDEEMLGRLKQKLQALKSEKAEEESETGGRDQPGDNPVRRAHLRSLGYLN